MRAQAWESVLGEARAAARVDHIGAVRIYDVVSEKGWPWIVMEPLPGRTLQQALDEAGPLPVRQVTRVGLRLVTRSRQRIGRVSCTATSRRQRPPVRRRAGGPHRLRHRARHRRRRPGARYVSGYPGVRLAGMAGWRWFRGGVRLVLARRDIVHRGQGRPPFDRGSLLATLTAVLVDGPAPSPRAWPAAPGHRRAARQGPRTTAERQPRPRRAPGYRARARHGPGPDVLDLCVPVPPARHFADVIGNPDWRGQAPRTQRLRRRTSTPAAGRDGMSTKTGARGPGRRRGCTRCDGWLAGATPGATGSPRSRPRCAGWRRWWRRAAPPEEVFTAVAAEVGRLLGADHATMARYDPDGAVERGRRVEQDRRCRSPSAPG